MKNPPGARAVVTALVLSGAAGCQHQGELSEADITAVRDVGQTYARLMNARDFGREAALYAEDAIILPPNRAPIVGRAGIQAFLEGEPAMSDFRVQLLEAEGRQDLAYAREMVTFVVHMEGAPPCTRREQGAVDLAKAD